MLHTLNGLLAPAFAQRLTLALNHIVGAEAVATDRLRPHSGRVLVLQLSAWPTGFPMVVPAPGPFAWRVTPAGLLEWLADHPVPIPGQSGGTDLLVQIDASNPALLLSRALAGQAPAVQVEGDAQLAGDINWLMQNLRWDAAADLERFVGRPLAQPLHSLGAALANAFSSALAATLRGAEQASARWRRSAP